MHPVFSLVKFCLLALAFFLQNDHSYATHILFRDVSLTGQIDTEAGSRPYTCSAHLKMPVICWEDLERDGLIVEACSKDRISIIGGAIDAADYVKGVVLTFVQDDYYGFGCPPPPSIDELTKVDQVIFRKIIGVKVWKNRVSVETKFVSGARVIPNVELSIGDVIPASSRQGILNPVLREGKEALLPTSSRLSYSKRGSVKIEAKKNGSLGSLETELSGSIELKWSATISGGFNKFKFNRNPFNPNLSWDAREGLDIGAEIIADGSYTVSKSDEIFKVGIPGAGFSIRLSLLGTVSFGFTAALSYVAELSIGAAFKSEYSASFNARQRVTVGLFGNPEVKKLLANGRGHRNFDIQFGKGAEVEPRLGGFLGLRPVLGAEVGIWKPLSVDIGASFGVEASLGYQYPPFKPLTKGKRNSVCNKCHSVQGTIDIVGKDLSINLKASFLGEEEITILEELFSVNLGTVCQLRKACPVDNSSEVILNGRSLSKMEK